MPDTCRSSFDAQYPLSLSVNLGFWLPDETLFSWCSRYHRLSANGDPRATRRQLFGELRAAGAHDLPSGIDKLVERTQGILGSAEDIVLQRTLLPYYLPFRRRDQADEAILRMRSPNISSLKFQLGLLTSGLGASHPLKYCPACVCEDERSHSVAYWHLVHQLPTVFVCPVHGISLSGVQPPRGRSGPIGWTLPGDHNTDAPNDGEGIEFRNVDSGTSRLHRLAGMSASLIHADPAHFAEASKLGNVLRERLLAQVPRGRRRGINWRKTLTGAKNHFNQTRAAEEFDCLRSLTTESGIRRILAGRSLSHPVRYMTLIEWLFRDWQSFVEAYDQAIMPPSFRQQETRLVRSPCHDSRRREAVESIRAGAMSITAVARRLSVGYYTVAGWVADEDMIPQRRPKSLEPSLRSTLVHMLNEGSEKARIVKELNVSISTVNRVLRTEPGLTAQWRKVQLWKRREDSRAKWQAALGQLPGASVCLIRKLASAEYAWLYRHDRKWLQASIENRENKPVKMNHAAVRMHHLDQSLAHAVEQIALTLAEEKKAPCVRWEDLIRELPTLKTRKIDSRRFPLTVRVLERLLIPRQNP